MTATGLSPEIAAQIAANLRVFTAELDVFSAGLEMSAALSRLACAQDEARAAHLKAMRRPEVTAAVASFGLARGPSGDMRVMLDDIERAGAAHAL